MAEVIFRKIIVGRKGLDVLIWRSATSGLFLTSSVWDLIRVKGDLIQGST